MTTRRRFLQVGTLGAACACAGAGWAFAQTPSGPSPSGPAPSSTDKWICPPCGCSADGKEFDKQGFCPDASCGMPLIRKPAPTPQAPPGGGL